MANLPRNSAVLVLAWPEVTARGEEGIIKLLRSIGVVKNVNMMVGHAAMIVAEGSSLRYYDFGRYITPRRMGRIRSAETDPALTFALMSDVFYIGALGSKRTHSSRIERLKAAGFSKAQIDRVHGPIGLDIGAAGPAEIAVSVMAEMTRVLRLGA